MPMKSFRLRHLGFLLLLAFCFSAPSHAATRAQTARADVLLNRASDALVAGRLVQAQQLCRQALQTAPGYARAYVGLGYVLSAAGDKRGAADALWSALEHNPTAKDRARAQARLRVMKLPPTRIRPQFEPVRTPTVRPPVVRPPVLATATPFPVLPERTLSATFVEVTAAGRLRVKLGTDGSSQDFAFASGVPIERALLPDADTARQLLQSASISQARAATNNEANAIIKSGLAPNEALLLSVRGRSGNAVVTGVFAVALVLPERVLDAQGTQLELASYRGQPFDIQTQVRFFDAQGKASSNVLLESGSAVAVFINPNTSRLYAVSAQADAIAAAGDLPGIAPTVLKNNDTSPVRWTDRSSTATTTKSSVMALALSPSRRVLVSGALDGAIRLWDANSGELLRRLQAGRGVLSLAWIGDSTLLAGGADGTIAVWRAAKGQIPDGAPGELWSAPRAGPVRSLAVSPDGMVVAAGHRATTDRVSGAKQRGMVTLWDASRGRQLLFAPMLIDGCEALTWLSSKPSERPQLLISDGRFPLSTNEIDVRARRVNTTSRIYSDALLKPVFALTANQKTICAGDESGTVHLWPINGNDLTRRSSVQWKNKTGSAILALALSPDGQMLAIGSSDGKVSVVTISLDQTGSVTELARSGATQGTAQAVAANALVWLSNNRLAVGSNNGEIIAWQVR